jgi:hypothetical protein
MGIGYEEFGRRLIESIVTADRVEATLAGVAGGSFETSIKLAAGLVRAQGSGGVTEVHVDLIDADVLAFAARLHFEMQLLVRVSGVANRYTGGGTIVLILRPVIDDDLSIVIDVPDVTDGDVTLKLRPEGTVAAIIDQLGSVEDQARRELARYVNARKDAPEMLQQRRIDVDAMIETEWARRRG